MDRLDSDSDGIISLDDMCDWAELDGHVLWDWAGRCASRAVFAADAHHALGRASN